MIFDNLIDVKTRKPVEIEDSPEFDQDALEKWKQAARKSAKEIRKVFGNDPENDVDNV